jgi:FixJ family two-component response regulator
MTGGDAIVFVVHDDADMRRSLENLIRSVGLRVAAFASAQEFLRSDRPEVPGCLVLDVRLPVSAGSISRGGCVSFRLSLLSFS